MKSKSFPLPSLKISEENRCFVKMGTASILASSTTLEGTYNTVTTEDRALFTMAQKIRNLLFFALIIDISASDRHKENE